MIDQENPVSNSGEGSEFDLVERARQGDSEAFDALVVQFTPLVQNVARRLSSSAGEVEDVLQETFIRAFLDLPKLQEISAFPAWIARLAHRTVLNYHRRYVKHALLLSLDDDGEPLAAPLALASLQMAHDRANSDRIHAAVSEALSQLPITQRSAVELHYLEGYDYRETAARLRVPETAIRGRLERARQSLRKHLNYMDTNPMNTNPEKEAQDTSEAEQPTDLQRYDAALKLNLRAYFDAFGCSPELAPAMHELIEQMAFIAEEKATRFALYEALGQHEALRKDAKDTSAAQLDLCHSNYERAMKTLGARCEDVWARYCERFALNSQPRLRAVVLFASPHSPFPLFRFWMMGFDFPSPASTVPIELKDDSPGISVHLTQKLHTSPEFFELRRRRYV